MRQFSLPALCSGLLPAALLLALGALPIKAQTSWKVGPTETGRLALGVDVLDTQHVYVAGATDGIGPHLGRSSDFGQSFEYTFTDPLTTAFFWLDIDMVDEMVGFAGGFGGFGSPCAATTVDGGVTWLPIAPVGGFTLATAWEDVFALDANTIFYVGFAAGFGGEVEGVARSDDGGSTWTVTSAGDGTSPRRVFFLDGQRGWLASGQFPTDSSNTYRGVIERTIDGGTTWQKQFETNKYYFNSIQFVDSQNGWAAADGNDDGTIFHTSDGGATWTEQKPQASVGLEIGEVCMIDALEGWAAGWGPGFINPVTVFHHTTDGGNTWVLDPFSAPYGPLHIDFADSGHGISLGANNLQAGAILIYDNGAGPQPPVLGAVNPGAGDPAGLLPVSVTGSGFTTAADTQLSFGGVAAPSLSVVSPTLIQAQTPAASGPGPVDVQITSSTGSDTLEKGFLYLPALILSGPTAIGTSFGAQQYGQVGDVSLLGLSSAPASVPTPFGTLGIDLAKGYVLGAFPITSPQGVVEVPISIPQNPGLVGLSVYFQSLVGLELTNTEVLVISD